jgi:hypothetical protein
MAKARVDSLIQIRVQCLRRLTRPYTAYKDQVALVFMHPFKCTKGDNVNGRPFFSCSDGLLGRKLRKVTLFIYFEAAGIYLHLATWR